MQRLTEVEKAKALMIEAMDWSVVKWLWEKKRVREAADRANEALDQLSTRTRLLWPEALRAAYAVLGDDSHSGTQPDEEVLSAVRPVKQADEQAFRARMDAEDTFDRAEKQLSTSLACEGCRKAIDSWKLHEHAIRTAEQLISSQRG
jgi:hypothetical protein